MLLLFAAVLPGLFWEGAPDTAPALREAGIHRIVVPSARLQDWKGVPEIAATPGDIQGATKLLPPKVNYRADQASATRAPWLDANGWRIMRQPGGKFYYDVPGKQSALAAAEAYSYGADALIRTDTEGLKPLAQMLEFLSGHIDDPMSSIADIGFIDDGSPAAGEVMNLLVRNNLLFRIVPAPDSKLKLNVKLGTKDYPLEDARNPTALSHLVRSNLTDEKRTVRVYGSQVVVARVTGSNGHLRLQLLNYGAPSRKVDGLRVRVLGRFANHKEAVEGSSGDKLLDYTLEANATEFTLRELNTYAVIDLSR
jgi:hypothetical protein